MKIIFLCLLFLTLSCSKVEPLTAPVKEQSYTDFITNKSQYITDQSSDIFEETPWYIYDENNHIIWPTFSVYALRTNSKYYKVQILDYYDSSANPGNYTLRIAAENESEKIYSFNAAGCGNVYTNRDYESCMNNPLTNIYKYLNIETGETYDYTSEQALESKQWDLAFNGTSIRINAGKYGKKGARIGSLFIYTDFFPGGVVDYQRIAEVSFSDRGSRFFNLDMDLRNIPYALPPGVDRVINEPDWFSSDEVDPDLFKAKNDNWWLIRSSSADSYFKFNVADINEVKDSDGNIETTITIESYYQAPGESEFSPSLRSWQLESFSSAKRLVRLCLDLDQQALVHCSKDKAKVDLTFMALNREPRQWKIQTASGAIGPLSLEDISSRSTGKLE
ncbi:putative exported protein [Halobacteriovorax marinus SJ]|uniref:Exported protein n=1 Tax=Halobacteriovorax marinus (strain ATCC BAA-682 / DSM 15412 / SJ) TaxID=862908 RepID=E1X348_HALMS|nr:HmuY family protein [Halobacteriovorax marinus]CBW26878.1 putative exported protein [Halobacteriovorax marinus SJ]